MSAKFPCPCCGHQTLLRPGYYEVCPVCSWEDDDVALRWPLEWLEGPNGISLVEAQERFAQTGKIYEDQWQETRPPTPNEPLDPGWHRIDSLSNNFERYADGPPRTHWPRVKTITDLYWWRPTYWRSDEDLLK